MDKILLMLDLKSEKNVITIMEGDITESAMYNREEIIEQLSEIIEFLEED